MMRWAFMRVVVVSLIGMATKQSSALSSLSSNSRSYASISSGTSGGGAGSMKKQPNQQQRQQTPKNTIKVAIIGGGIAGLSCAQHLTTTASTDSTTSSSLFDVTVFDTGRLRPGGRCASRLPGDRPKENDASAMSKTSHLSKYIIDHAAQVISIPSSSSNIGNVGQQEQKSDSSSPFADFYHQVQAWEAQGVVTRFPPNSLCCIEPASDSSNPFLLKPIPSNTQAAFYGTTGMANIPRAMVQEMKGRRGLEIKQDVWVSPSNGARYILPNDESSSANNRANSSSGSNAGKWKLQAGGRVLGYYDQLVIAHNGKCADRLMSNTPAKALHRLLQVNFAPTVDKGRNSKMTLNSIYSLTFIISKSKLASLSKGEQVTMLPEAPFISGFVQNDPALRFLTCQTRKHNSATSDSSDGKDDDDNDLEVWTVLSSPGFATKYKAPQEFLPPDTVQQVTSMLLQAVERSCFGRMPATPASSSLTGIGGGLLESSVLESRLQLWGAALPLNTWQSSSSTGTGTAAGTTTTKQEPDGFLYDAEHSVGVCGDWLLEPSIAGAWTSGRLLANHLMEGFREHPQSRPASVGLGSEGKFSPSQSASQLGIGALDVPVSVPTQPTSPPARNNYIDKKKNGRPFKKISNNNNNPNTDKNNSQQPQQQNARPKQSRNNSNASSSSRPRASSSAPTK
jgi:hypothetical protein